MLIEEAQRERKAERALPPFQMRRAAAQNDRMMNMTLTEVRARKHWILLTMLMVMCLSAVWYWLNPPMYRSLASFFVAAPPLPESNQPIYLGLRTEPSTLVNLATSSDLFDRLIERFDLHARYHLPGDTPASQARLYSILEERILASFRAPDLVEVRVMDPDRAVAAAMANAVCEIVRELQHQAQHADLDRQLRVFTEVIDSTDKAAHAGVLELVKAAALVHKEKDLTSTGDDPGVLEQAENALLALTTEVTRSNQDLIRHRRERMNLLTLSAEPDADRIRLKTRATEDQRTSPFWDSVKRVLMITLVSGAVAVLILLLIIENWLAPAPRS